MMKWPRLTVISRPRTVNCWDRGVSPRLDRPIDGHVHGGEVGEPLSDGSSGTFLTTVTSTHLLDGLRDPGNSAIWQQYIDRYRPMLVSYAQRVGLSGTDAEDVAQLTLVSFCTAYQQGKYDRERGRLRVWLFGIARNQIANWRRRKRSKEVQIGDEPGESDFFAAVQDEKELETLWDREWREAVMAQCLSEVRREVEPKTFEAFELFAGKGLPADQVAEKLGMTANAVFGAKRRILRRVRELLPQLEEVW
jgi:RNA polymerase sigma-70 factor (ECF subfamily)